MATKTKQAEVATQGVVVSTLVVGQTGTIAYDAGPPDTDVTFTVAPPGGGVTERTVRTDDNGRAEIELVPNTVGELNVAVTQTAVTSLGAATAEVVIGVAPPALAITGLDPPDSEVGPPQSFLLTVEGDGFDINTKIGFGVFSQEEADAGLGEVGEPKWELGTRYIDGTHVGLDISAGQFPGADPAVPVVVGAPDGTVAGPVNFAFTEPVAADEATTETQAEEEANAE